MFININTTKQVKRQCQQLNRQSISEEQLISALVFSIPAHQFKMGGANQSEEDKLQVHLMENYSAPKKMLHPILGLISLQTALVHTQLPAIFHIERRASNEEESERKFQQIAQKGGQRPAYYLKQVACRNYSTDNICGDSQFIDQSLGQRIKLNRQSKTKFTPSETLTVAKTIAQCLKEQHAASLFLNSLTSEHVLIGKHFTVKVIDHECVNSDELPTYQGHKDGYSDPQLLKCLQVRKTQLNHYDPFKANVWAAGLIFMQMLTLQSAQQIYNYSEMKVDSAKLTNWIRRASEDNLTKLAARMLNLNSWERPTAEQIWRHFSAL